MIHPLLGGIRDTVHSLETYLDKDGLASAQDPSQSSCTIADTGPTDEPIDEGKSLGTLVVSILLHTVHIGHSLVS